MREMKDSGVEWIGEIPSDWELTKIGSVYDERNTKVSDEDYPPLSVTKQGVVPQLETAAKTDNGDNRKLICKNDFVINSRSDRRGSCGISEYEGSCSLINTVLMPQRHMCNRYYGYVFKSDLFADEYYRWGHGIVDDLWSTKWSDMKNIYIPMPKLDEQEHRADYLDSKCSKIDEIIVKQEQIVEKLKEYKLSVITEALTKGLDSDAKMKDSEIEGIGKIAYTNELCRLKTLVEITDGTHDTPLYVDIDDNTHPLVTSKCIVDGIIDIGLANHISDKDYLEINKRSKVEQYDVIMPMIGTVGNPALVDFEPNFAIKNVALLRTHNDKILGKYVVYLLNSRIIMNQFELLNRGGVQNFISQDKLKNLVCIKPSDMKGVVEILDKETELINRKIKKSKQLVSLLHEYKKSLIYEVVTGKKEV